MKTWSPPGGAFDTISTGAADLIRALLDTDAKVWFAASGTAANALALATLAAPHEAVLLPRAQPRRHQDETGAPGFFGSGVGLAALPGASGRIELDALARALAEPDVSWSPVDAAALSLTNATEYGVVYTPAEIEAPRRDRRRRQG